MIELPKRMVHIFFFVSFRCNTLVQVSKIPLTPARFEWKYFASKIPLNLKLETVYQHIHIIDYLQTMLYFFPGHSEDVYHRTYGRAGQLFLRPECYPRSNSRTISYVILKTLSNTRGFL